MFEQKSANFSSETALTSATPHNKREPSLVTHRGCNHKPAANISYTKDN